MCVKILSGFVAYLAPTVATKEVEAERSQTLTCCWVRRGREKRV